MVKKLLLLAPLAGLGGLGLCLGAAPAGPPLTSLVATRPKLERECVSTRESATPPRSTTRAGTSEDAGFQAAVARGLSGLTLGQSLEPGGAAGSGGYRRMGPSAPLIPINDAANAGNPHGASGSGGFLTGISQMEGLNKAQAADPNWGLPRSELADGDGEPGAEDSFEDCEVTYELQHPVQRFLAPVPGSQGGFPASSGTTLSGYSTAPAPRVRLVCDSLKQFEERSPGDRAQDARALLNKGRGIGWWENHWTEVENGKIASGNFGRVGLVKPVNTGRDPALEGSRAALKALKGGPDSAQYDRDNAEKRREYRSAFSALQREIDVVSHIQRELSDPQEQGDQGVGGTRLKSIETRVRGSRGSRIGPVGPSSTGGTTLDKIKSIYEWVETRVRRQRAANGPAPAQSFGALPALPEDLKLPHPRDVSVLLYQANYGDLEAEESFFRWNDEASFIRRYGAERGPEMFRKEATASRPWTAYQFCARKDLQRFMRNYASYDKVPKLDDPIEQAAADEKWGRMSPLEWRARLGKRWIVGMFTGLVVFRQCGVVHRDVKPDNFGVGKNFELKYLDFGLAKQKQMGDLNWGKHGAGAASSGVPRSAAALGSRQTTPRGHLHVFCSRRSTLRDTRSATSRSSYNAAVPGVERGIYGASSIPSLSSFIGSYVDFHEEASDPDGVSGGPNRSSQPNRNPESEHHWWTPEVGEDHNSGTPPYMGPTRGLNRALQQRVCEFFDSREDVYAAMTVAGEILSWVGFSGSKRHWNMGKLSTADTIQRYYWVIKGIERRLKEGGMDEGHEAFEIVRMAKVVAAFAVNVHESLEHQALRSDTVGKPTKTRAPPIGTLGCDDPVSMLEVVLGGGDQEEWISGSKSLEHALATKVPGNEKWNLFFAAAYTGDLEVVRSTLEPRGWFSSIRAETPKLALNDILRAERASKPIKTLQLTLKEVCEMHGQDEILKLYQSKTDAY